MKKLISLLLAVSVMLASTSAFALSLTASGQRNPGSWSNAAGGRNSSVIRDWGDGGSNLKMLATYRPGDTIGFKIKSELGLAAGDTITFISSAYEQELSNATVMFIDQFVATSATPTYEYKIRPNLPEGRYKIDIKCGDAELYTCYYGVADPDVQIAAIDEHGTQAYTDPVNHPGKAQYFASATIGGGLMFEQAGVAGFGFDFNGDGVADASATAAEFDEATKSDEIAGVDNVWFTVVLTGITGDAPEASDVIINE